MKVRFCSQHMRQNHRDRVIVVQISSPVVVTQMLEMFALGDALIFQGKWYVPSKGYCFAQNAVRLTNCHSLAYVIKPYQFSTRGSTTQ